jgi:nicotinamide-nucleotide amidase
MSAAPDEHEPSSARATRDSERAGRVALLAIGDELLEGRYADSNSAELARELRALGIEVGCIAVEGDDEEPLARRLSELARTHALILSTGGLGPTLDDVTREAAARAAGVELVESEQARLDLAGWYERRGAPMPPINLRQIRIPRGSELVRNPIGTAPGFAVRIGAALHIALPGPPHEMRSVWQDSVRKRIADRSGLARPLGIAKLYLFDLSESLFAERVGARMQREADPLIGVTASDGRLSVLLTARTAPDAASTAAGRGAVDRVGTDPAAALAERARAAADQLAAELAPHVYSRDEQRLERVLARELLERRWKVATAESCTGGLVAAALTAVPGSSAYFERGWICYADAAKYELLGVPRELLERHGAVSAEVAAALARGTAERSGAELSIAVTGIAGPDGGSPDKPVGTVWFGIACRGRDGATAVTTHVRRFPPGDRERIRRFATNAALYLALRSLRAASS